MSTVIHRSGCFFWHSCGELIQHRPHDNDRTGSSPIRSQRTIQPRSCARGGIGLKTLLSSRFRKIFYDCYVSSTVPLTTRIRAKAALGISPPGSFLSHSTAARIWGRDRPEHTRCSRHGAREGRPDLTPGCQSPRCGRGTAVTSFRNLSITTPEQTFSDLATSLDLVALVVLGDSLVKSGRKSVAALRGLCCTTTHRKQHEPVLLTLVLRNDPDPGTDPDPGRSPQPTTAAARVGLRETHRSQRR